MSEVADVVPKILKIVFLDVSDPFEKMNIKIFPLKNSRSFWSECYQVFVESKSEEFKEEVKSPLFVKIPRISAINEACDPDNFGENMEILRALTSREVVFYNAFKNVRFPGFPIPKFYYGESLDNESMAGLVCEDFSRVCCSIDHIPGFNDSQIVQLLRSLAGFHAKTIEISETIQWEKLENDLYDPAYIRMLYNDTLDFEKICPRELSGRIQAVKHAFDENGVHNSNVMNIQLGLPFVICHNDLNASNILWNKETGKIESFIDFQHVAKGPITFDLIRTICIGLSVEERRENTKKYLEEYYSSLKSFLSPRVPFTFNQLLQSYSSNFNFVNATTLFSFSYYYKIYKDESLDVTENADERNEKANEVLRRTIGILDEIHPTL